MPPIRAVALLALFLIGHPGRGTAQTIRRSTLDSIALRPPALADSTPVYRAALEGGLDSLLARAGNSRYYIQIPHEAVPAATELIPPLIRARRAKGWCVWDRKDSCLTRGHFAIVLARLTLHSADSASVPFSIGRVGDKPRRNISNTADEWLEWPEPHIVGDGVLRFIQPPQIILRRTISGWSIVAMLPALARDVYGPM